MFDRVLLTPMLIATAGIIEWSDRPKNRALFIGAMLLVGLIASAGMRYEMFNHPMITHL